MDYSNKMHTYTHNTLIEQSISIPVPGPDNRVYSSYLFFIVVYLLQRRLQQVEEFQSQIQSELKQCKSAMNNMEMRSSLQAVRLLAKCSELNVQLPELDALKKVRFTSLCMVEYCAHI